MFRSNAAPSVYPEAVTAILRRARDSDVDALVSLRAQMFDDMGMPAIDEVWRTNCHAWFRASLSNPDVFVLVAEEDGNLLACGMAELAHGAPGPTCPSGRTVHLSNVVTLPTARGQGHGTRIVSALVDWAGDVADRVELHASQDARALYGRLGFKEIANPTMRLSVR